MTPPKYDTILCRTMEEAMVPIRRLADPTTSLLVYDSETTGLDQWNDLIVGHVLTFGPRPADTYYVPVRHGEQHQGNVHSHRDKLGHPFEVELNKVTSTRRDLHTVGHNLMFDLMFNHRHGVGFLGEVEDTQVNEALLNEFAPSFTLGNCCIRQGTPEKKGDELYKHLASLFGLEPTAKATMGSFWKLPGNDPWAVDYATGDGISTWHLRAKQLVELEKQELLAIHLLESKVTRVLYRMKKRGIRVDMAYLDWLIGETKDRVKKGKQLLPDDFNVRGPAQIRKLMEQHGHLGWPMTSPSKKFPNGQPSFNEAFLKTNEIGKAILAVRKWEHLENSFLVPLRDRHTHFGRVHSTYWQMAGDDFGTVTGRLSSSEPNLQQVPKRNKEIASLFRPVFIPDEGQDWWDADLSQCEPRLLAHYSGAKALVNGYTSDPPVDAHQAVTNSVNAIGVAMDREDGKRLNQTLITGGGKGKISLMLGDRGEEIYDAYFKAMPEIKTLQQNSKIKFRQRGYVISLLGRRARLERHDKDYLAMNRLLQCGNADVVKKAMVDVDNHFESNGDVCALLNSVHDALSMQGPPDRKEELLEALRLFTDFGYDRTVPLRVPMVCDYGIGKNWGEATFPKEKLSLGHDTRIWVPSPPTAEEIAARKDEELRVVQARMEALQLQTSRWQDTNWGL